MFKIAPINKNNNVNFKSVSNSDNELLHRFCKRFYQSEYYTSKKFNKLSPSQVDSFESAYKIIEDGDKKSSRFISYPAIKQCSGEEVCISQSDFESDDNNTKINLQIEFSQDLTPSLSRAEKTGNEIIFWQKNMPTMYINQYPSAQNASLVNDFDTQFEIIFDSNNSDYRIIQTRFLNEETGGYEIIEYNLNDYPEDCDVLEGIKNGTIDNGKKIASFDVKDDGSIAFYESFSKNQTKTTRTYFAKCNKNGEVYKEEYSYTIVSDDGNVLLDINRTFEKINESTTITTINGKTYISHFDFKNAKIDIIDEENNQQTIDVLPLCQDENDIFSIMTLLQNSPADLLLQINKNKLKKIIPILYRSESYMKPSPNGFGFLIGVHPDDARLFAHEVGHLIDYSDYSKFNGNQNIKNIYIQEWNIFNQEKPLHAKKAIEYFSPLSRATTIKNNQNEYYNGGLCETVAEVNLLTKFPFNNFLCNARSMLLVHNFPNTIAQIAKNLGY
ncbi:hypothetical protein IJ425_05885 [bacterium]|nr:hypothetical protein [bacterium]